MKKLVFLFLLVTICTICATAQTSKKNTHSSTDFSKLADSDSFALLNNPAIKIRLEKLLGAKSYAAFLESFETVTPVEKNGTFLFSSGCLIHACTHLESAIAIDLNRKTIHAAIYNDTAPTRFFNEKNRKTPEVIKAWANRLTTVKNDNLK